ncbi:MAG: FAD-binding oxidoreductase [Dehalococcoidia bacterium]
MTIANPLVADLTALLGSDAVLSDAAALPAYGQDFLENRGTPGVVVRPQRTEDVAAVLRYAAERGIAVVPRAAGTNVAAAFLPSPERIMLDLRAMNRILSVDPERRVATVEPGVLNGDLNARVATHGLFYPPDPASFAISTIGGNIATNAGGPHCLKYGVTVHHVEAVTSVLAGGDLLRLTAADRGPDLLGVMIGSEGTLGIVTQATVRLQPRPAVTRTLLAVFDRTEDAVEAVSATIAAGLVPAAIEYFDRRMAEIVEAYQPSGYPTDAEALLLIDCDGAADEVAHDLPRVEAILRRSAREVRRADDEATRSALWQGRLLAAVALTAGGRRVYFGDITVPRECLPAINRTIQDAAARHGLTIVNVGHIGDGNFHPTVILRPDDPTHLAAAKAADDAIVTAALELGGTITGEHGVGSAKRHQMHRRFTPAEIAAMRAVKHAVDPTGILNPGILLPDPRGDEPSLPTFTDMMQMLATTARTPSPVPAVTSDTRRSEPRHDAPITLDAANLTVTLPADATLRALHASLAAGGFCTPLTPGDETIADAIGGESHRAAMRDALLAVRATLQDGPLARFGSNAVKDVAGYDLKHLFIGSQGAFGQIDEVTLRITPLRA